MANLNSSIINGFLRVIGKLKVQSLEIESSALVDNLNADLLDGKEGSEYASSTDVTNLTEQVNTNTGNILSNLKKIQDNTEAIGTNKDDISALKTRVTTAETNITTNKNNITTNKNNITGLTTRVTNAERDIDTNTSDISLLKQKTDTTNTNVSNLQSQVNTNATNIQTNADEIDKLKTKTDTTNANVASNTANIEKILEGSATVPSTEHAQEADNANKLGGQLPSYYAKASDLSKYLPLTGGTLTGKTTVLGAAASASFWVRGIMGCTENGASESALYLNYNNSQPVYINGTNLVYHSGNIPKASTTVQGIVQLNNTRTSTSTTQAATAAALKSAYDTVNGALTTHKNDTTVHLTTADRTILTKANKFKGYYETETALNKAHPTGEAGDYAIVNTTDTVWIWDEDKEGGAGWKDGAGKGSVISVNNMTGEVVLTKSNIGLGNVDNTSDKNKPVSTAQQAALDKKVDIAGGTMTGTIKSSVNTTTYLNGNNGSAVVNSTAAGSAYVTLLRKKSTNGVFTVNGYQGNFILGYTSDTTIEADNNTLDKALYFGESGILYPSINNSQNLGDSSHKWKNVYATTFTGALSGNASTATKLATARTISLTGDATATGSFDGSSNLSLSTIVRQMDMVEDRDVKPSVTPKGKLSSYFATKSGLTSTTTDSDYQDLLVLNSWSNDSGGNVNALSFDKSTKAIYHYQASQTATTWGTASQIAYTTSNVASATKLATARTIGVSGVTGTAQSFNGTENIVIPITAVPASLLTGKSSIKGSEITNDKHWVPSSDNSVKNFMAMSATNFASNAGSLSTGTIVAITDGVEGYVTTQSTGLTCDLPLDL